MTTNLMFDASILVVDFVCIVLSGIQMIHPYLATARRAAQPDYDCYPKKSWDDFSNKDDVGV